MQRRQFIKAAGTAAAGTALAGCLGASGEAGTLATAVSDQPGDTGDFETLLIAINSIRVKPADGELEEYDAEAEVDLI